VAVLRGLEKWAPRGPGPEPDAEPPNATAAPAADAAVARGVRKQKTTTSDARTQAGFSDRFENVSRNVFRLV